MSALRDRLRAPLAALLLAIWTFGGGSDLIGHALVAHVLCVEHGVVEHRVDAEGAHAAATDGGGDEDGPAARAAPAPEQHGEICQCAPPPAAEVPTITVRAPLAEVAAASVGIPGVTAPAPRVPLAYAPKTSPPV